MYKGGRDSHILMHLCRSFGKKKRYCKCFMYTKECETFVMSRKKGVRKCRDLLSKVYRHIHRNLFFSLWTCGHTFLTICVVIVTIILISAIGNHPPSFSSLLPIKSGIGSRIRIPNNKASLNPSLLLLSKKGKRRSRVIGL